MIATKYWKEHYEDAWVLRIITTKGKSFSQGKRFAHRSAFSKQVQQVYVEKSTIAAIIFICKNKSLHIKASKQLFNELRGTPGRWRKHEH